MAQQCTCRECGYTACCCEMEGGLCGTCQLTKKKQGKPVNENYCEQTREGLDDILKYLKTKPNDSLRRWQIAVVKSQVNMFDKEPCKFKPIIDVIANEIQHSNS